MPDFKEKEEIFETENNEDARFTDVIVGRNPVTEALRAGREIDKLLVAHGAMSGSVRALVAKCRERGNCIFAGAQSEYRRIRRRSAAV